MDLFNVHVEFEARGWGFWGMLSDICILKHTSRRLLEDKNICLHSRERLASTNQQEAENKTMLGNGQSRTDPAVF